MAEQAARAGYRATMRGRVETIPGLFNKVLAFLGELPPRRIAQAVFGMLSRSKGPHLSTLHHAAVDQVVLERVE